MEFFRKDFVEKNKVFLADKFFFIEKVIILWNRPSEFPLSSILKTYYFPSSSGDELKIFISILFDETCH